MVSLEKVLGSVQTARQPEKNIANQTYARPTDDPHYRENLQYLSTTNEYLEFSNLAGYLVAKHPFLSQPVWQQRIDAGCIAIGLFDSLDWQALEQIFPGCFRHGILVKNLKRRAWIQWYKKAAQPLCQAIDLPSKTAIFLYYPPEQSPETLKEFAVVAHHAEWVAVYKPPNMVMHPVGMHQHFTLQQLIRDTLGDYAPVHRIDRETSGLVLAARSIEWRHKLSTMFAENAITKYYIAVSFSTTQLPVGFILHSQEPIGDLKNSRIRIKVGVNASGKTAYTHSEVLACHAYRHGFLILWFCAPATGRNNQIRVHLAHQGYWIVGDKMYHPKEEVFLDFYDNGWTEFVAKSVWFPRHMLHNIALCFDDYRLVAPLPQDWLESSLWQAGWNALVYRVLTNRLYVL
jgi:23S rRNA-/tRNA-specific pseudouridylate synthase